MVSSDPPGAPRPPRPDAPRRAFQATWDALPANARGALWMVLSAAAFTVMAGMIKALGPEMHAFQIAFFRCLFGLLILLPLLPRNGGLAVLRTKRPMLHVLRLVFGLSAMVCLFYSMTVLPFAMAVAISFARPLFMLVLAVLVLGERVGWRRGLATLVGFAGVLIVMRPDPGAMDPNALVPLLAALLVATAMTVVKIAARTESSITILTWFAIGAAVFSLFPALTVWTAPDPWLLAALVLVGAFGTLGQYLAVRAFGAGEASVVGPFEFSQILFAGVTGYLFFAEVPDLWTFVGSGVIAGSALYILWRETRLKKADDTATTHRT